MSALDRSRRRRDPVSEEQAGAGERSPGQVEGVAEGGEREGPVGGAEGRQGDAQLVLGDLDVGGVGQG